MRHLVRLEEGITKGGEVRLSEKKSDVGLPHVRRTYFQGLPVDVELDIGMTASGKDSDGTPWSVTYKHPYGEIPSTKGRDGDPVDVYLGPRSDSPFIYVVHQVKRNGKFDEDKVFLGFDSPIEATRCYFEHGPKWGFGSIETLSFDQFVNGYLLASRSSARGSDPMLIIGAGAQF